METLLLYVVLALILTFILAGPPHNGNACLALIVITVAPPVLAFIILGVMYVLERI